MKSIVRPAFLTVFALAWLAAAALAEKPDDKPAVVLDGELVQGGLVFGQAPAGSSVKMNGQELMISTDGHFVFGFDRDDVSEHELLVTFPDGEQWQQRFRPTEREFDIQRIDGLASEHVTPPHSVLERIRNEAAMTRRARERRDSRTDWTDGWIWPVTGPITGVYGSQRILNGQPRNPHWGLDIAAPTGTPVKAPAGGIITLTHDDMYFSGGTIFLDHGHGLVSAFLHLSAISVEEGQRVEQGELIGKVGATGRATGPHLDWRINVGNTRVDPYLLLPERSDP